MENLKILAWRNEVTLIRIFSKLRPSRKGSMIENTIGMESLKLEMKYGMPIPDETRIN